jgi:hypothetical protein
MCANQRYNQILLLLNLLVENLFLSMNRNKNLFPQSFLLLYTFEKKRSYHDVRRSIQLSANRRRSLTDYIQRHT